MDFMLWFLQGMPTDPRTKFKDAHPPEESADSFHSAEDDFDDEVEEQLDVIKILLLRAREHNSRNERKEGLSNLEDADFECDVPIPKRIACSKSVNTADESSRLQTSRAQWPRLALALFQTSLATKRNSNDDQRQGSRNRLARKQVTIRQETPSEDQLLLFSKIRHRRYSDVTAALDEDKVSVESRDEFGNTPLMLAAQTGSKRMCKILLRHGALLNAQNWRGQTALHFCYAFKYEFLGDYLVSKGADDKIPNDYGLTSRQGLEPERSPTRRHVAFSLPSETTLTKCNSRAAGRQVQSKDLIEHAAEGTIVVSVEEYQRLRACATPSNASFSYVEIDEHGAMISLDASEYARLKLEAARAHELLTPRKHGPSITVHVPASRSLQSVEEQEENERDREEDQGSYKLVSSDSECSAATPAAASAQAGGNLSLDTGEALERRADKAKDVVQRRESGGHESKAEGDGVRSEDGEGEGEEGMKERGGTLDWFVARRGSAARTPAPPSPS